MMFTLLHALRVKIERTWYELLVAMGFTEPPFNVGVNR